MQKETGWPEKKIGIKKEADIEVRKQYQEYFTGTLISFHNDRRSLGSDQVLLLD